MKSITHAQTKEIASDSSYTMRDSLASFPGGDTALKIHLDSSFLDPLAHYCISTCFQALLTISEEGKVIDVKITIPSKFKEIDDAFISTCLNLPKFEPAIIKGQKVKSYYYVFYDLDME